MTSWLNYHHLYYFMTIANEGSIAKASKKLRLGQPTLSTQLKVFEDTLGVQLFERKNKKLYLTEAGRLALDYANQIFALGLEMMDVIHDRKEYKRVHVQVGALDTIPKEVVSQLASKANEYGNSVLSIFEGQGDQLLKDLLNFKIDLFVTNYAPSLNEAQNLFVKEIGKAPVVIYGSPIFKHLKKNFPRSLDYAPFVLPTKHSKLRHDLDLFFKSNLIRVDTVVETQDVSLQKLMGQKGVGLIPLPTRHSKEHISPELIEIGHIESLSETYYLVAASRKIENPIASRILKSFHF